MARLVMESVVRVIPKRAVRMQKPRNVGQLFDYLKRCPVVLFSGPVPEARKEVARERLVFRRVSDAGLWFTAPGGSERYVPLMVGVDVAYLESGFVVRDPSTGAALRFEYATEGGR